MTRLRTVSVYGSSFTLAYLLVLLDIVPLPFLDSNIKAQILPTLPFNLLVALGTWFLWELGYGILTFSDCKEAHQELMSQIQEAKQELRKKGVEVD
ncbi:hypothetical protein ACM66B_001443 [Microbotryomycetes sp. NB124-2]